MTKRYTGFDDNGNPQSEEEYYGASGTLIMPLAIFVIVIMTIIFWR